MDDISKPPIEFKETVETETQNTLCIQNEHKNVWEEKGEIKIMKSHSDLCGQKKAKLTLFVQNVACICVCCRVAIVSEIFMFWILVVQMIMERLKNMKQPNAKRIHRYTTYISND